jgi:hypothetical protein
VKMGADSCKLTRAVTLYARAFTKTHAGQRTLKDECMHEWQYKWPQASISLIPHQDEKCGTRQTELSSYSYLWLWHACLQTLTIRLARKGAAAQTAASH